MLRMRVKYSEDEERDDHGRWTNGGSDNADGRPPEWRGDRYWASFQGSMETTGSSAKLMGIDGYKDLQDPKVRDTARDMLSAISHDQVGALATQYHGFENIAGTKFSKGDTISLPLQAVADSKGDAASYATRDYVDAQRGAPTIFEFPEGTQMLRFSSDESIVAGKYEVSGVKYSQANPWGFQWQDSSTRVPAQSLTVVTLKQTDSFDPDTGWHPHG